jgi:hypothetical protein
MYWHFDIHAGRVKPVLTAVDFDPLRKADHENLPRVR